MTYNDGKTFHQYQQNTTTYDMENGGLGMGQAHKCGEIKPVSGIL